MEISEATVRRQLDTFVLGDGFACVAGRAAFHTRVAQHRHYPAMADPVTSERLWADLVGFVHSDLFRKRFATFVATFAAPDSATELEFERLLWEQLQLLHDLDCQDFAWSRDVDSDTASPNFEFSVAEQGFFVVGLHPGASRTSRRFAWPALAFNAHEQFQWLYRTNRYQTVQAATRKRDLRIDGSLNPNLAEFGVESQAKQFSGRATPLDWRCPLIMRHCADAQTGEVST